MDMDHEIALMYASNPFGFFQPQTRSYSPFGNVVLRVVRPRPRIEDLILGLLSPSDNDSLDIAATDSTGSQPEINSDTSNVPSDSTLEYDLSERMAREMQEQEDRDQQARDRAAALRQQFGDFVSSVFGSSDVGGVSSTFRRQPVNAEAGPSAIKPKPNHLYQAGSSSSNILNSPMAEQEVVDEANKSSGKERARPSPIFGLSSQSSSMDLLDSVEAALRHEVNKFDFPERLEFADNVNPLSGTLSSRALPTPALSRTSSNALVHMYEQAMLDLLANLDVVANDQDENVQMRRIHLVGKIRRELDDLDRKVLETWAARRRYTPARESV